MNQIIHIQKGVQAEVIKRVNDHEALKAKVELLEAKLEEHMCTNEEDVNRWIIALQSFKARCIGLSYEKHIIAGLMRLIGSFPKNEWLEEKEQMLIEEDLVSEQKDNNNV